MYLYININTYESTNSMRAPMIIKTACMRNGTKYGVSGISIDANPANGGKIASPKVPNAICLPTSPRPNDVSLVAMTQAEPSNARAAVGQISASTL